MKKLIIALSILLVVLLGVAAYLYFCTDRTPEAAPEPVTEPTATPTMQIVIETVLPTEPEIPPMEVQYLQDVLILNGVSMTGWVIEDETYVSAEDFAVAVGLTLESTDPVVMSGEDKVEFSEEGLTVTVYGETSTVPVSTLTIAEELSMNGEPFTSPNLTEGTVMVPFHPLVEALGYPEYVDAEQDYKYYTPSARRFEIPEDVDVPVIMYHAVSDDIWGTDELFVSPEDMEEQLEYLVENEYDPIWFEDLAHLEDYEKPVILTFDDGYDDNYTELYPLLQKYNVKATIFIITECIGNEHKMNEQQIQELSQSGLVSIQSHSHTHRDMDTLDEEETAYEMSMSKLILTRLTGKEPSVLCYPTGKYNQHTLRLGPDYFMFGLKMTGGQYNTSDDPFLVSRYYMSRFYGIGTFSGYIRNAGD